MPTRLKDVRVLEVSLVDRPANKRPLLLWKSEDGMPKKADATLTVPEGMAVVLEKAAAPDADVDAKVEAYVAKYADGLSDECKNAVRLALRALVAFQKELPGDVVRQLASAAVWADPTLVTGDGVEKSEGTQTADGDPPAEGDVMTDAEKQKAAEAAKAETEQLRKAADESKTAHEALAKEHADTKAKLEAVTKANADLADRIAKAEAEAKRRDAVVKAAKEFPHLDQEKVVSLLLKFDGDKDALEALEVTWKQAEALAKAGGLGTEIGSSAGGVGGDAYAKLEQLADAHVAKSSAALTREQAMREVMKTAEGKRLYAEYRAGQQ